MKNKSASSIFFIISASTSALILLFIISIDIPLYSRRSSSNIFLLPPVFDINYKPKPVGNFAWLPSYSIKTSLNSINSISYFPDGRHIAVGDIGGRTGGYVAKINLHTGREIWKIRSMRKLYGGRYLRIKQVIVSPNGRYIAVVPSPFTGGTRNHNFPIKILDANTGRTIRTITQKSFLPDCAGKRYGYTVMLEPHQVKFTKDSRYLISYQINSVGANYGSCLIVEDRWIFKWDILTGKKKWKIQLKMPYIPSARIPENSCLLPKQTFDISPNGKLLVISNCAGQIFIHDINTGRKLYELPNYLLAKKRNNFPGFSSIIKVKFSPANNHDLILSVGTSGSKTYIASADLNKRKYDNYLITGVRISEAEPALNIDTRIFGTGGDQLILWDKKLKLPLFSSTGAYSYNFKFNPVYREIATIAGKDVIFIHLRKRRSNIRVGKKWTNTGIYVSRYTAFYINTSDGEFIKDVNVSQHDNRERAYSFKDYFHNGLEYHHKSGYLFLKSRYGETLNVGIIGGLSHKERNVNYFRSTIPRWGFYPNKNSYGAQPLRSPAPVIRQYEGRNKRLITIKKRLIELAVNFRNEYMSSKWSYNKSRWYYRVKIAKTPYQLAKLLLNLEKNVKWAATDSRWRNARRHFRRDGRSANSYITVANMMITFENSILSLSQKPRFRRIREEWLKDLNLVISGGERQRARERERERENRRYNIEPGKANEELRYAINTNNPRLLRAAIAAGGNVNLRMTLGSTVLHMASAGGDVELVKILLKHNADVNLGNIINNTPIMIAAYRGRTKILKLLIKAGAKVNGKNKNGKTPLMYAAQASRVDIIKILLKAGANVNTRDNEGNTAINHAGGSRYNQVVKTLRMAGGR